MARPVGNDTRYLVGVNDNHLNDGWSLDQVVAELRQVANVIVDEYMGAALNVGGLLRKVEPDRRLYAIPDSLPCVIVPYRESSGGLVYTCERDWDFVEVHNNLRQMCVLVEALGMLSTLHPNWTVTSLSPTQQPGFDAAGMADDGGAWALEVFGGHKVGNNSKAGKDAHRLTESGLTHRYFACFTGAWKDYQSKSYQFGRERHPQHEPNGQVALFTVSKR